MSASDKQRDAAVASAVASLSQLVARVLDQLSRSAWLPSAATVVTLIVGYGLFDGLANSEGDDPATVIPEAARTVAGIGLAGVFLLATLVFVLTLATQAFAFNAIRTLEGYWLPVWPLGPLGRLGCWMQRQQVAYLLWLQRRYTRQAWKRARRTLEAFPGAPISANVIAIAQARIFGERSPEWSLEEERQAAEDLIWETFADADMLRRRDNVRLQLRDFPEDHRMLPTKLGNVLRTFEDATGKEHVESFIQRVFADLPVDMQIEHDEQRTRLEIYCTLVFVAAFNGVAVGALLATQDLLWAAAAVGAGLIAAGGSYLSAISSARAYGGLLMTVAEWVDAQDPEEESRLSQRLRGALSALRGFRSRWG